MKFFLTIQLILITWFLGAQVTTDPEFPVPSQSVTITLDTEGTDLENQKKLSNFEHCYQYWSALCF